MHNIYYSMSSRVQVGHNTRGQGWEEGEFRQIILDYIGMEKLLVDEANGAKQRVEAMIGWNFIELALI